MELAEGGPDYFHEHAYPETRARGGLEMTFWDAHRPLSAYARALEEAGLRIEALREPRPDASYLEAFPELEQWTRRPAFLLGRAVKPV